jgi:predicted O-methyltransferase YrrM
VANFVDEDAVDFIRRTVATEDGVLASIKGACRSRDLPSITPEAGRFIQLMLRTIEAERVLEIGTCLGYSGVWIARALPEDGTLETIELDGDRAEEAAEWFAKADVDDRVQIHEGKARAVLPTLPTNYYDAFFIDADKEGMSEYLDFAVRLTAHGGLVFADNVFWQGTTFTEGREIDGTQEVRGFVRDALDHSNLDATILPLGDGLLVGRVG